MQCPNCSSGYSTVKYNYGEVGPNQVRQRGCKVCKRNFTTMEVPLDAIHHIIELSKTEGLSTEFRDILTLTFPRDDNTVLRVMSRQWRREDNADVSS